MTSEVLRCRMDNDIRTQFDRPLKVWRGKSVIDTKRYTFAMRQIRTSSDVNDLQRRVGWSFSKQEFSMFIDRCIYLIDITCINKSNLDTKIRQDVLEECIRTAVNSII